MTRLCSLHDDRQQVKSSTQQNKRRVLSGSLQARHIGYKHVLRFRTKYGVNKGVWSSPTWHKRMHALSTLKSAANLGQIKLNTGIRISLRRIALSHTQTQQLKCALLLI